MQDSQLVVHHAEMGQLVKLLILLTCKRLLPGANINLRLKNISVEMLKTISIKILIKKNVWNNRLFWICHHLFEHEMVSNYFLICCE